MPQETDAEKIARLERRIAQLESEVERVRRQLEEAPRAVALVTQLNKGLGLPYGKTAAVLEQAFGLVVTRGGLCQAIARVGRKAEPTYRRPIERVRSSPGVTPDETG